MGQTYVIRYNGGRYQSRVSDYNAIRGLDLTMGAPNYHPPSVEEALGRPMGVKDTHDCFDCHATAEGEGLNVRFGSLVPGVQCENCHGPAQHVRAVRSGDAAHAGMPRLEKLSSEDMADFRGRCHRTWLQIELNGPHDIRNIRFQPYRFANSKCYDSSDRRTGWVACHDPHRNVEPRPAAARDESLPHGQGELRDLPHAPNRAARLTQPFLGSHHPDRAGKREDSRLRLSGGLAVAGE